MMNAKLIRQYDVQKMSIAQLHGQIRSDFHQIPVHPRAKFKLVTQFTKWLLKGMKSTTVRYRPNAIDVPTTLELPLIESSRNDNDDTPCSVDNHQIGTVMIANLVIKPFATLDDEDALRDGFSTQEELREALQELYTPIYGPIDDNQYISIYTIRLIEPHHR